MARDRANQILGVDSGGGPGGGVVAWSSARGVRQDKEPISDGFG